MPSDQQAQERIEELRRQLHLHLKGPLDRDGLAGLMPVSQELDRLAVEVTRRRWERSVRKPGPDQKEGRP